MGSASETHGSHAEHASHSGRIRPSHPPEGDIYRRIHVAIAERRLLPGARLVEDQLGEVFGVSRMRIRSVLHALARDKVVTLQRNRGAMVAYPSVKEAREVFAARRIIEVALAARGGQGGGRGRPLRRLNDHIRKEREGEDSGDRAFELRASHEFHTLLADIVGNRVIVAVLRDLMARSSLITAIYERPDTSGCSHVSHASSDQAHRAQDGEGLAKAMLTHLEQTRKRPGALRARGAGYGPQGGICPGAAIRGRLRLSAAGIAGQQVGDRGGQGTDQPADIHAAQSAGPGAGIDIGDDEERDAHHEAHCVGQQTARILQEP